MKSTRVISKLTLFLLSGILAAGLYAATPMTAVAESEAFNAEGEDAFAASESNQGDGAVDSSCDIYRGDGSVDRTEEEALVTAFSVINVGDGQAFAAAVKNAGSGDTIQLTAAINYTYDSGPGSADEALAVGSGTASKAIIVDVAGYDLTITNDSSGAGLLVSYGSSLTFDGSGGIVTINSSAGFALEVHGTLALTDEFTAGGSELNLGGRCGLAVYSDESDPGSASATVTGINVVGYGIESNDYGGKAVVLGDINCTGEEYLYQTGIWARGGFKATIGGSVNSEGDYVINAQDKGTNVHVTGDVNQTADGGYRNGIAAWYEADVFIGGAIFSSCYEGILAGEGAKVYINNNYKGVQKAFAVESVEGNAVRAHFAGTDITVNGNVKSSGPSGRGVDANEGAKVVVNGDSEGFQYGVDAKGAGTYVEVTGDCKATYSNTSEGSAIGAAASSGAEVVVGKDVASGRHGVSANGGGSKVTVSGAIKKSMAPTDFYISFGGILKEPGEHESFTTKQGYHTYTEGPDAVWVKNPTAQTTELRIDAQPVSTAPMKEGSITGSLSVVASFLSGSGTISYQWYENDALNNYGGTAIEGATTASFTIPMDLTGGLYSYFCELSAAGATPLRSDLATVTVLGSVPAAQIDFAGERLTGLEEGNTYRLSWMGEEGTEQRDYHMPDAAGQWPIVSKYLGKTMELTRQSSLDRNVAVSEPLALVMPARRAAPTSPTGGPLEISGVSSAMEYRKIEDGAGRVAVPAGANKVMGLAAGPYDVRYKATDMDFASADRRVEVVAGGLDYTCQIVGKAKRYYALSEAILDATGGDTIRLLNSISQSTELYINKNIAIDLNGKTLSSVVEIIIKQAEVTIKNGGLEARGIWVEEYGKASLPSLVLVCNDDFSVLGAYDFSEITVNGDVTLTGEAFLQTSYMCSLTINGNITTTAQNRVNYVIGSDYDSEVWVAGSIYTSGEGFSCRDGKTTVNGTVTTGGLVVNAEGAGSVFTVGGRVTRTDGGAEIAVVDSGARAVFNGPIPNLSVAVIDGARCGLDEDGADTTQTVQGYTTYTGTGSAVWLKELPVPAKTLTITPGHAILTANNESVTLTAALSSGTLNAGSDMVWSVSDDSIASITPSTDKRTAEVKITDDTDHAILLVTAVYTDTGGLKYTATATVELLSGGMKTDDPDPDKNTMVKLLESKATINTAMVQGALVPVLITGRPKTDFGIMGMGAMTAFGAVIDHEVMLSGTHAGKFTAAMSGDRHLEIRVNTGVKKGTYKDVNVKINGIAAGKLNLTVTEKFPKIKLKAGTLNLAFPGETASVTATSPDGECTVLRVDTVKQAHKGMLVYENGNLKLDTAKIGKAASISTVVHVSVAGYKKHYKTAPKLNIKAVNTQPGIKLEKSTLTFAAPATGDAPVRIVSKNKKRTLESWGVIEGVTLDGAPRASVNFLDDHGNGFFVIPGSVSPGKHTLHVWYAGNAKSVNLMLTVKNVALNKVTLTSDIRNIVISAIPVQEAVIINIMPSAYGVRIDDWEITKGKGALPAGVEFKTIGNNGICFEAAPGSGVQKTAASIALEINSKDSPFAKPLKLTLSVTDRPFTVQKLSLKGKLDVSSPTPEIRVEAKLGNTNSIIAGVAILDADPFFKASPAMPINNTFTLLAADGKKPVPGVKYPVNVRITLLNDTAADRTIYITPTQSAAKGQANRNAVTLYKATPHTGEAVALKLTGTAGIKLGEPCINAASVKNNDHFDLVRAGETTFNIKFKEGFDPMATKGGRSAYKSSYTIKLELWAAGTYQEDSSGKPAALGYYDAKGKWVAKTKPTLVKVKVNLK